MNNEYSADLRKLLRWSLVLVFVLAFFLAVLSANALKEYSYIGKGVYPTNTLSVTGEGEVQSLPDVAQFNFTVTEEASSVSEAQDAVTEKISQALDSLRDLGVEEKDIKTTGYNANPRYEYPEVVCMGLNCPRSGDRVLSGYEVSQTIAVKVRDTAKAGEALSVVANTGISNVGGLQFVIDDQDVLIAEARVEAIADAEEKIQQLAESLGVKVKKVVHFSESFGEPYPMYERAVSSFEGMGGDAQFKAPQLPTGENTVRVQVYVTYEIK